ncbi:fibrobacter succinogenes major paralogous domain-containing protein [Carboxylicivirga linearis]|uniref:Fibrobacter succinogenes major paralogous domain-containing protein n=1 Tax=Carboxylicivirga linearis TaxID=1628157 RepID=A0ABS5JWX5_9BACT|nr:fibrobacter succinogenes major paralogous domain-containing protein [Carboxylicivirga linearis]MBS2099411.1 fibrobacter succinogenes major paralogous domain-containing protein [Carboxylicivirga linearis]
MKKLYLFTILLVILPNLAKAQDYTINFTAGGDASGIDEITATNLTTNETITVPGSDAIILRSVSTQIDGISASETLQIASNPYNSSTTLKYQSKSITSGIISINSLSGMVIQSLNVSLSAGDNQFKIAANNPGIYIVTLITEESRNNIKVIQTGSGVGQITYEGSINSIQKVLKSSQAENVLNISPEDIVSMKIRQGNLVTILNDVPEASTTIDVELYECKDGDNNTYPIVQIGNQWWMAENLKTTTYSNGTPIPNITSDNDWSNLENSNSNKAYCFFNNNADLNFGALYTYGAAVNGETQVGDKPIQGACPTGWHVPNDKEWNEMLTYLINNGFNYDGSTDENKVAKALASNREWESYYYEEGFIGIDLSKNNKSGFTALSVGVRYNDEGFSGPDGASWWSFTESDSQYAYNWYLTSDSYGLGTEDTQKSHGLSVRCIKD